jgi:hypothetical protein
VIERLPSRPLLLKEEDILRQGGDQIRLFRSPLLTFVPKVQEDQSRQPLAPGLFGSYLKGMFNLSRSSQFPGKPLLHKERTGSVPVS